MTGGGWNVACGTVPDPAEAVGTAGTTGVAAGDDATAGAGPAGTLTGGALAGPLLAGAALAGAALAAAVLAVLGGAGASATTSAGGPAARVAARRGLRVRRGGAADSPPSPGSLPLAGPGCRAVSRWHAGLALPGLAVPVTPDGAAPPSLSLPRAVSF